MSFFLAKHILINMPLAMVYIHPTKCINLTCFLVLHTTSRKETKKWFVLGKPSPEDMTTIESLEQRHHVLTVKHSKKHPIKMTSIVCLLVQYLLTHLHHHWLHHVIKNKCRPIP
jgi:hypothetical protein